MTLLINKTLYTQYLTKIICNSLTNQKYKERSTTVCALRATRFLTDLIPCIIETCFKK